MKIKNKNTVLNWKNSLYYFGIILITFCRLTQDSTLFNWNGKIILTIKLIAAVCFLIKIIFQKYRKKEIIIGGLILSFSLILVCVTKIEMVLLTAMILIGMKDISLNRTIKCVFYVTVIVLCIQSVMYIYNWNVSREEIKILLNKDLEARHYVYFSHPNMFAGIVFGAVLEWLYLYGIKLKKYWKYVVTFIVMISVYFVTISRTTLILFLILLVGLILVDVNQKRINQLIKIVARYSFTIISIITVLFLNFYHSDINNKYINKLDEFLSGRISLGLKAKELYGVGFAPRYVDFEQKIETKYVNKLVIDNFYMRYSISYGYISLIILSVLVYSSSKKNDILENLYLIIFSIWGITEGVIFDIAICIVLLIISSKLLNNYEKETIKKNRILVFGITDNPGGMESVIMNYYRNINRDLIQFDFLCNTKVVAYEEEINSLGGNIYKITARSKNRIRYQKEMKEFFNKFASEYSTIWLNTCSLANIDYLKYAKKYGIKYRIIHSHNSQNMDSKLRGILHKINKLFLPIYATDFWACSEEAGKFFYFKNIRKSHKYLLVNNAIDTQKYKYDEETRKRYRKEMNIEDKIVIGNIGRLHFQKNQEFLIDIMYELNKKNDDLVLLVVGQGEDEEKLKCKVKKLKLEEKVRFLGVRKDIAELLQVMDIFVFPSLFEGLGLVLIEAQAAGILCFTSRSRVPDVVNVSKNIHFIELNNNAEEWANKILEYRNYKRNSLENIENIKNAGYDIKTEVKRIEKFFERK